MRFRRSLLALLLPAALVFGTGCSGASMEKSASYASAPPSYGGGFGASAPQGYSFAAEESVSTGGMSSDAAAEAFEERRVAEVVTASRDESDSSPPAPAPPSEPRSEAAPPQKRGPEFPAPHAPPKPSTTPGTATAPGTGGPGESTEVAQVRRPMLIYVAGLWVVVDEPAKALAQLEAMTREMGGFLSKRDDASIILRIPVARFEEALAQVGKLGEIVRRDVSVEDVTEAFVDMEIRLKNLRAIRTRLERLLEKAASVAEAVAIERELARVSGEIESIEGKMKLLQERAAFSTLTVYVAARGREVVGSSAAQLPVPWLGQLGLGRLFSL
ncbi:DUF4349 domain-containing protein [Chondromyces apiculatus]|uniref:DUF4349 domain-containing protein n=1 Tax=Chondromyces apiculatus DSM 436 TaxID=1192034 RepID=A0A017T7G5_9BACT|nr:DUF4349 domain-containing protein [Chondromyces apiculatus]EYF04932.1 Hypothetical protein CAP_3743 [Chondromyces apiculatus DSM 436]